MSSTREVLGIQLGGALGYALLSSAALSVAQVGLAVPFWPAAGLAFALAYRYGALALPGLVLGSMAGNTWVLTRAGVESSPVSTVVFLVGVGAALQAWVGAAAVKRFNGPASTLTGPRDIFLFLALGGVAATTLNPSIGTGAQLVTGLLSRDHFLGSWLTWWIGDSAGVMLAAPLALMGLPGQGTTWEDRRWKVALPSTLVGGVLIGFVLLTDRSNRARLDAERTLYAGDALREFQASLSQLREVTEGIGSFMKAAPSVSPEAFRAYTQSALRRHSPLHALSWNPLVPSEALAAFEQDQRRFPARGAFRVSERDAAGTLVPASPRREHVVVQYIEPLEQNSAALGFDITSNPSRLEAINRARESGRPTFTRAIDLVQETARQKGALLLTPVFAGEPRSGTVTPGGELLGYSVGVFRLQELLQGVFDGARWTSANFLLWDATDAAEPQLLATSTPRAATSVDRTRGAPGAIRTEPFDAFGRRWLLQVSPVTGPLASPGSGPTLGVLAVALGGMFAIQMLLLLLTGLEMNARKDASDRTYEATHDGLTGLLNRRGFLAQLHELTAPNQTTRREHVLLFCDLDRFKTVNDTAGHEGGDAMLRLVADQLRITVRRGDLVARLGGDEFALLLVDCPAETGERTARNVVAAVLAARLVIPKGEFGVGISVGLAPFAGFESGSPEDILRAADLAAYDAKRSGGGVSTGGRTAGPAVAGT